MLFHKDSKDFEGRCVKCKKELTLYVHRVSIHEVKLTVDPCPEHPNDSLILWPYRKDIEVVGE